MNIYETGLITMNKGKIIVLEGLDGCGKSTQEKPGLSASRITRAAPDGSCLNICRGQYPVRALPEPTRRRDFTLPTDMQATSPIGKTTTKTARLSCPDVIRHLMLYIR